MMKSNFEDTRAARQASMRTVMAAEACSELGLASEHVRRAPWPARWLQAVRRWLKQ